MLPVNRFTSNTFGMETKFLREQTKSFQTSFDRTKFSGEDPVMIFYFLMKFVEEAETPRVSESHAFLILSKVINGRADRQIRSIQLDHALVALLSGQRPLTTCFALTQQQQQYAMRVMTSGISVSKSVRKKSTTVDASTMQLTDAVTSSTK